MLLSWTYVAVCSGLSGGQERNWRVRFSIIDRQLKFNLENILVSTNLTLKLLKLINFGQIEQTK